MRYLVLLACVAGCATSRPTPTPVGPQGRVVGTVIGANGEPLEHALITLDLGNGQGVASSDAHGHFTIERVPVGTHHLAVSLEDRRSTLEVEVAAASDTVTVAPVIDTANLEIPFADGGLLLDRAFRVCGSAGTVEIECETGAPLLGDGLCPDARRMTCHGDASTVRPELRQVPDPVRHCDTVKLDGIFLPGTTVARATTAFFDSERSCPELMLELSRVPARNLSTAR